MKKHTEGRIKGTKPKDYKGVHYKSTLEADTAELFDKLNIPFMYEPLVFTLQESFIYKKKKYQAIKYIPDFLLPNNILIECKGFETPEWKLKKKIFFKYLASHPTEYSFYEIHKSGFKKNFLFLLQEKFPNLLEKYEKINKRNKLGRKRVDLQG